MGFAVLHIQKPKGNDSGTTAHIERAVSPANADPERKHLNKNLIEYPDGIETRTQAIQHRIENAGIKRKISHNQVRALQIMLSGTPEDMQRIQASGRLGEWCDDNVEWLQDTFGKDNVVSAVLHMDEKTPHIHATVVPIVVGERRKARETKAPEPGKKQYRKKDTDTARLDRHPNDPGRFRLTIDGIGIIKWFREQHHKWQEKLGLSQKQVRSKGISR